MRAEMRAKIGVQDIGIKEPLLLIKTLGSLLANSLLPRLIGKAPDIDCNKTNSLEPS